VFVNSREIQNVAWPALLVCAVAWLALLFGPGVMHGHDHVAFLAAALPSDFGRMLPTLLPGWFTMLAAMMPPALISSVVYIRSRSFASRRHRSVILFVAGYLAVWTIALAVLIPIQVAVRSLVSQPWLGAAVVTVVALVWQCCPFKQVCLNRCHSHRGLAAFGYAADRDALRFGVKHGFYCVGSCWALMLLPMLLSVGHLAAMAIATVLIFGERVERPRLPNWRWRGPGPVIRIATSMAKAHFDSLRTPRASIRPA
jgi:predicted metal-binding membrane protein